MFGEAVGKEMEPLRHRRNCDGSTAYLGKEETSKDAETYKQMVHKWLMSVDRVAMEAYRHVVRMSPNLVREGIVVHCW
ncbi:hypothetical protein E2C01_058879 [Portunus trituberculatus]|uniref:Uncharacterized protein n=1 Tax=Portunus trituberculatus TaxID=210409 RepID=A0A5B7H4F0_PORTR|nr:hypothetical protein [Portunus trituberculatus]